MIVKFHESGWCHFLASDLTLASGACRVDDRRFPMLMMAPEGTCGDNRCILHFRTGAFVPGVPVLPVLLKYRFKHHNPSWIIINVGWEFVSAVPTAALPAVGCLPW